MDINIIVIYKISMNKLKSTVTNFFNPKNWSSKKRTRRRNFTYKSGKDVKGPMGIKFRVDTGKKTYVNPIILLPYLAFKKKTKKQKGAKKRRMRTLKKTLRRKRSNRKRRRKKK